jgi:sialic acid synthase SpsE
LFQLGVPLFKISSGDLNNIPFLVEVARYRRPIILSTGMATLAEVRDSVLAIGRAGNRQLTLLHCTTDYPAAYRDVNLRAMATLREAFKLPVGLSDHTPGIEVSVAAAALGAEVIEKHFTLDKGMSGPDHQASLSPDELADLVKAVRNVEAALGDGCKAPRPCERAVSKVARKSLVAASDILPGMKVTPEMVTIKRPGTGMLPSLIDQVIGSRAVKRVDRDALLRWTDFDRGRKRK